MDDWKANGVLQSRNVTYVSDASAFSHWPQFEAIHCERESAWYSPWLVVCWHSVKSFNTMLIQGTVSWLNVVKRWRGRDGRESECVCVWAYWMLWRDRVGGWGWRDSECVCVWAYWILWRDGGEILSVCACGHTEWTTLLVCWGVSGSGYACVQFYYWAAKTAFSSMHSCFCREREREREREYCLDTQKYSTH